MVKAAVLPLFLTWITFAATMSQERFKITGTVVNSVTGEPVNHVLVSVSGSGSGAAMSGADGHFEIADLQGGAYVVLANRPGFVSWQSEKIPQTTTLVNGVFVGTSTPASPVRLLDAHTPPLLIKLVPTGSIEGRVLDNDGIPIKGLSLSCLRELTSAGRKQWVQAGAVATTARGGYKVDDLQPGRYLIKTQGRPVYATAGESFSLVYPGQYYPNSQSRSAAQAISLGAGQKASADFSITPTKAHSVSGTVNVKEPGMVSLATADEEEAFSGGRMADGEFQISNVPPGKWNLIFQSNSGKIEIPIEMKSADITNLKISLQPPVNIEVHLQGLAPPASMQYLFRLIDKEHPFQQIASGGFDPNDRSNWELSNLTPGSYRAAIASPAPNCVESVRSGSLDLLRDELRISAGGSASPIEISITDKCGTLSAATDTGAASLLVLPDLPGIDPIIGQSSAERPFQFAGLTPGGYTVYAFDSIEDLEYTNPEELRGFSAEHVTVSAGQTVNARAKLNIREER